MELYDLPTATRVRVKVETADGRTLRLGRVTVDHADGNLTATSALGEQVRQATIAEVQQWGQNQWVVRTADDERWLIMGGGCGCGGG